MRLLQLSTDPDRLIDLHPYISVVFGLDAEGRQLLVDTVAGLAQGAAPGPTGLLEAHGLLFDLSEQMLELLEIAGDGLRPVVTASELPTVPRDPRASERDRAERSLADLDEAWTAVGEEQQRLHMSRDSAAEALEVARRNAQEVDAGSAERTHLIDELAGQLDQLGGRRRQLLAVQAERRAEAEAAAGERLEVEAATVEVRTCHQKAASLCSQLAGRLDEARLGLDSGSVAKADAAAEELARVQAEVEAERSTDADLRDAKTEAKSEAKAEAPDEARDEEPPDEWLARVEVRVAELEKRLAAFGPTEVHPVADALSKLRARQHGELVPSPVALELADQLEALDAGLTAAAAAVATTSQSMAEGRARLDAARRALQEAEQAVRTPELDRDLVERLELAHADVLLTLEKADGRFGGGRAARRVEEARSAEQALLDELGFTSYSDYMMGYSLLNVDPEKEARLEAARAELSAAEDDWRTLEAEAEAERTRGERTELRGRLIDEAGALLGREVTADVAVRELRAMHVPVGLPPDLEEELQRSLEEAGVAVGDEDLSRGDLMVLAEAWLDEADSSSAREQSLRREMAELTDERLEALAAVEDASRLAATDERLVAEKNRQERVRRAQANFDVLDARRNNHVAAEAMVAAVAAELAAAVDAERRVALAAADAEASVAAATDRSERLAAEVVRIGEELAALQREEGEANEQLRSLTDLEHATPEDRARQVREAEAALALADERVRAATVVRDGLEAGRIETRALIESLQGGGEPVDTRTVTEEVEWYLLARLAAQRAVCLGGSLPMLLDDALAALDEDQLTHVLGRLERMADAVQVIVVSDDPRATSWATAVGLDRAAAVQPQSPDSLSEPQTAASGATT